MADQRRNEQELVRFQALFTGTGSADITAHEFHNNVHRDTLNSFIGHPSLLQYTAIGLGQTREQTRVQMLERMIAPVGPPKPPTQPWADTVRIERYKSGKVKKPAKAVGEGK